MKLDIKSIVIIILASILIIGVFTTIFFAEEGRGKYERKIDALEDSIQRKEHSLEVHQIDEKKLKEQIYIRELEIISLRKSLKYLKIRTHEKADSIYILNNHNTFSYISNYLSKRDSIR